MYKEQKLKANHNTGLVITYLYGLLSNVQRTKVESKSQLGQYSITFNLRCYQMYKEQKLKANHNDADLHIHLVMLLSNVQRTKVESKSQHTRIKADKAISCYQMYKEQKLKANHNGSYQSKL